MMLEVTNLLENGNLENNIIIENIKYTSNEIYKNLKLNKI